MGVLLGGRRTQQPTIYGSGKGDGWLGQERKDSGWQRLGTGTAASDESVAYGWIADPAAAAKTKMMTMIDADRVAQQPPPRRDAHVSTLGTSSG